MADKNTNKPLFLVDEQRQPVILDKGCYWLICLPVPPDDVGWCWFGMVWVKGKTDELTTMFKRTIEGIETTAAAFMDCKESD